MKKNIVILGAGFGGLEAATTLSEKFSDRYEITLIDKRDSFFIGFSKFEVLFGRKSEEEIKYSYKNLKANKTRFIQESVTNIDIDNKVISTMHSRFSYDYLIVALGADLYPSAIPGFVESGGHEFYSLEGAKKLHSAISDFKKGTILLTIFSTPYKCPPAPYEGAFQLVDYFTGKGVRQNITIKVIIPTPIPIPVSPDVSREIERLLTDQNIELIKNTRIIEIDSSAKNAVTEKKDRFAYDLFIGIPVHTPPPVVRQSKLGEKGFILVNRKNLQTEFENVYAVGDVATVPVGEAAVPKAGVFAEDGAKTVVADILRKEGIEIELRKFEAAGACYFEFGGGKVGKIDANFLGGEKPRVILEGLTSDLRREKIEFEAARRDRWFK
ncbi:MAG TPA: FAD-dependent oxidoreductase [Bacteroidota bacterium]|nr:FAD-dependent oxidoreductase [Bacteroidota bacterium]